jgi:hypothetical protein
MILRINKMDAFLGGVNLYGVILSLLSLFYFIDTKLINNWIGVVGYILMGLICAIGFMSCFKFEEVN